MDPLGSGSLAEDTQHAEEFTLKDICCTRDYLLVEVAGIYYVHAFSDLKVSEELWTEESIPAEKVIPVEDAGERYQNLLLVPAEYGTPGVDLISVRPHEVRRTYRLPPEQPLPGYFTTWFDFTRDLVIAIVHPTFYPPLKKEEEPSTYHLAWDLETGRLVHRMSLITPYRREDCWEPFLNDHYLHYENILQEVPSFRPVHTFEARDIVGIAGDKVVTVKPEPYQDAVLEIYRLPGFQKVGEVIVEGYRWVQKLSSRKYFLLAKNGDRRDFILVNLEDLVKRF